jgi:hypothetical protein
MLRRSPLRAKPKYKPVAVQRHHDRVAALGCLVSGQPATLHHVTGYADRPGRFTRDDWLVVPLAPEYHLIQHGPKTSVEALGHQGFFLKYGIDLLAVAMRLSDESQRRAA